MLLPTWTNEIALKCKKVVCLQIFFKTFFLGQQSDLNFDKFSVKNE